MEIRPASGLDRPRLDRLLHRVSTFTPQEVACALELIDAALAGSPDYLVRVAAEQDELLGYICYGPTPMTEGTWDLYWIATDPAARGKGAGRALVRFMEADLEGRGGRRIRVETSATEEYGPTRGFYEAMRYVEEARFRDFYKVGDDLVILSKKI